MTAPLYIYCSLYRCANRDRQAEANQGFLESFGNTVNAGFECVIKSTLLTGLDILASITCLILGILGACSVIGMSAAAAYALIGINCAITLLWGNFLLLHRRWTAKHCGSFTVSRRPACSYSSRPSSLIT